MLYLVVFRRVVATVSARDADTSSSHAASTSTSTSSKLDYFNVNGDEHNQFAISPDGKLYTRLMIDRETRAHYELEIAAFDGKYRDLMRLRVHVADVSDQRPVCAPPSSVRPPLDENTPIGTLVYTVTARNLEPNVTRLRLLFSFFSFFLF